MASASTISLSPAKKRQKTTSDIADVKMKCEEGDVDANYTAGNIVEIELRNFMTYDHIICHPAPRLNLVIGPNGSGKSSIVCAIALGLAGDPQILGRASNVGAFVKRGQDSGYVKISLRGHRASERIVIVRKISSDNKSEWVLNGVGVSKRDVIQVIQKFNIQVNNLTQFLPQDRVCEFAKLSPTQLLEETEKAVGDPELSANHHTLIQKSRELKKLELAVKQNGDSLDQLEKLNAEQERDVDRVREREQLLAKADLMKKKLPWLKYDLKKMEYMEAKHKEDESKKKFDAAAAFLNELSTHLQEQKNAKERHQGAEKKKIDDQYNQNVKKRRELIDLEGRLSAQVRARYTDMEEQKRLDSSRQQRIVRTEKEIDTEVKKLAELPIYAPRTNDIENLRVQIMEFDTTANQRKLQITEKECLLVQKTNSLKQCCHRLADLENKNAKLLHALRNAGVDKIHEAYEWVKSHRNEFRKEVYGPVLLEVSVRDKQHAAFLEGQVPFYIWKSFIAQDPNDRDFLYENLKFFDIPILTSVKEASSNWQPYEVPSNYRELGVYTRLDQVFDAPDVVRDILISQSAISGAYVGTREADQWADRLQELGVMNFWTPESHYRFTISRYGGHTSGFLDSVHASRLFLCSSDVEDLENIRKRKTELLSTVSELEENLKELKLDQRQLEDKAAKLRKERDEISTASRHERRKREQMESCIVQKKRQLASLKNEADLESNSKKVIDQIVQLNAQRFQNAMQIKNLLTEGVLYKWKSAQSNMGLIEIDSKIAEMEAEFKRHQRASVQVSAHFEQCKEETENCRKQLSSAKWHAEKIAVITKKLADDFLELPTTIEELEDAIQDTTSKTNSILFVNQNILQEYEDRQCKIDAIKVKQVNYAKELKRCLSEIDTLKEKWLPTLRSLVSKINETFSHNFQEMAVAGEVSLDEHEVDFDKFGILIKVKFRQGSQLQVLSAHHQSGGERSVSTILYLVSLQDLTNCPFRVVDEINQGMDLVNERKMFQQLVRAASHLRTPQCFLLTPKLLDNLEYTDACSVLNIMNGPWIKEASEVWKNGKCWRRITS